jgi:hypothetical protein
VDASHNRVLPFICAFSTCTLFLYYVYNQQHAQAGATHVCTPEEAVELIMSLTNDRGADIVIEMVGCGALPSLAAPPPPLTLSN